MKIIKILSLFGFSLIFSLIFFFLLEFVLGFFVNKNADRLSDILRLLKQDSVLFWKQKANLNVKFQNQNVQTNKIGFRSHDITNKNKKRIICLGASPTFGWGVKYEDTYPVVLGEILRSGDFDVETVNAGEIGYSSYQGLNLLKEVILDLNPDIITVSYVINDIDKYRFFRSGYKSDNLLSPLPQYLIYLNNIIYNSNLFKIVNNILSKNVSKKTKYYGKNFNNKYHVTRRVSLEEYEKNLNDIIEIAQSNGIKVLLVVMPVNLPAKKILTDSENLKVSNLINNIKNKLEQNDCVAARQMLTEVLSIDKFSASAYYYLGILADKEKQFEKADEFFEKAKNFEIFDCALVSLKYNDIMRKIAESKKVSLSDCAKDFRKYNGDYLFVDPKYDCFHPNSKGHKIIASAIAKDIIFYLGDTKNGK